VYLNTSNVSSVEIPLFNFTNPYSIESVDHGTSFQVLPNPAGNSIQLRLGNQASAGARTWQIFDLQGRLVGAGTLENLDGRIDISTITAGVYTIIVRDGHSVYQQKLVKQSD
jgi:hypothetical protein